MKKLIYFLFIVIVFATFSKAATPYDFDGDGKSDFAVGQVAYPNAPADFTGYHHWYISRSSDNSLLFQQWGADIQVNGNLVSRDAPRPADYDGDGKTDFAIQRRFENQSLTDFYILNSSNNTITVETFGRKTDKTTIIGDYDGDGKADLCAYGKFIKGYGFYYKGSLNNPNGIQTAVFMGYREGVPYRGDFDGDNKLDFCVWINQAGQPSTFNIKRSSDGGTENVNWGLATDIPTPGDYDGDGKTDFCVRRENATNYLWYILERDGGGTGASPIFWGGQPAFAFGETDFDGDGKTDIGVYRQFTGLFSIRKSSNGQLLSYQWTFGSLNSPIYNLY